MNHNISYYAHFLYWLLSLFVALQLLPVSQWLPQCITSPDEKIKWADVREWKKIRMNLIIFLMSLNASYYNISSLLSLFYRLLHFQQRFYIQYIFVLLLISFRKNRTSVTSAGKPSTAAPPSTRTRASTRATNRSCASFAEKDFIRKVRKVFYLFE